MTTFAKLQSTAFAFVAALFVTTVCVSAAIGPVVPIA